MGFGELALVMLVALLGSALSVPRWLRLPVVIGELLLGLAIGVSGFGLLNAGDPTFAFLASIGFALVMFEAGTHVPIRNPRLREGLAVGAARAVGIGVLAVPAGLGLAALFGTGHGAMYAVLIASSSSALVMPALQGVPTDSPAVLQLLAQLAIADAACIVALPLVVDPAHAPRAAIGALAVLACAGLLALLLRRTATRDLRERVAPLSKAGGLAVELRVSLLVLFTVAAVAAATHVSVMLAGFAVGIAVTSAGEPRRLARQVFAVTDGFFGPVFYVWLGASLNLHDVAAHPASLLLGLALGASALAVHGLAASTGQRLPVAVVTAAQLGVPVGAVALGKPLGVFGPGEATALLVGALVTVAVTAVLIPRVRAALAPGDSIRPAAGSTGR